MDQQQQQQEPIIEVKNIVNRFGDQLVHDGLDMTIYRGEILGLVGGSGSGKSVLLRTILGLRQPTSGQVFIGGHELGTLSDEEMLEVQRNWGVLFQNGALFSGLSVLDNIALPMREHYPHLGTERIDALAMQKLTMTGLKPEAGAKIPSDLSGGMARRAGLARALALDPAVVFLDEPTVGLDPIAANDFDELILSLRDALGLTVLVITHDLDTLTRICDRICMIIDKKIVSGTLEEMMKLDHPWIRQYFGGPRMRAVIGDQVKA
jgi:phospholipid/cholesterol/gamma-HCH transport system ATP-binding protein